MNLHMITSVKCKILIFITLGEDRSWRRRTLLSIVFYRSSYWSLWERPLQLMKILVHGDGATKEKKTQSNDVAPKVSIIRIFIPFTRFHGAIFYSENEKIRFG